jgi:agmatinase
MTENRKSIQFLGSSSNEIIPGSVAIVGCPLDITSSYRTGSDHAPQAVREASDSIETYSPFLDRDLCDQALSDLGDIPLADGDLESSLEIIENVAVNILEKNSRGLFIGGEHTITLPIIKAMIAAYPQLVVIHADAHTDLREEYAGSAVNHATVIRRVIDLTGPERLIQVGIRSGTRDEFLYMQREGTRLEWNSGAEADLLEKVRGRPAYLTLDLDVMDPSCLPGTGNPEPGGWSYSDLERLFRSLDKMHLVGADVVELNPGLDTSDVSSITAAKIIRELALILSSDSRHQPATAQRIQE